MPARGTMGWRLSRLRIDGAIEGATHWTLYSHSDPMITDSTTVAVTTDSYVESSHFHVPTGVLLGSTLGVLREVQCDGAAQTIYSAVYVNGTIVASTEQTHNTTGWQTLSDTDIAVEEGDTIALYQKMAAGATSGKVRNFKLYYRVEASLPGSLTASWV